MASTITFVPAKPEDSDYFYNTRKEGMMPHMARIGRRWDENYERSYNNERFNKQIPYLRMIYAGIERVGFICVRPDNDDALYLESFCIERRYQGHGGISDEVIRLILQEPELQSKRLKAEIMKGYASGRLAERIGFRLIDNTGELDLYERPPAKSPQTKNQSPIL